MDEQHIDIKQVCRALYPPTLEFKVEIAHSGHQLCKGCGSGNSSQKQSLEEGVQYLKDTNFCDVEKIIRERSYD